MSTFPRMDDKICMVTGATSGIGKVTAATLAALGAEVLLVGRDSTKTQATVDEIRSSTGNPAVHPLLADFRDLEQVRALAAAVRQGWTRLDVLVNNAGAFFATRKVLPPGVEQTFLVNHLSPFLLTNLLLDLLRAAPAGRVVNVASDAHRSGALDLDDLAFAHGFSGTAAYARSKLANILFTVELARRLEGTGITANTLHPGVVATGIWKIGFAPIDRLAQALIRRFMLTPEEGADTVLYLAAAPEAANWNGQYFIKRKAVPPAAQASDPDLARRLWDVSTRLVGLT